DPGLIRRLAGLAAATAKETAEAARRGGRVVPPLRRRGGGGQRSWVELRGPRRGQQPLEGQRAVRQDAGQHAAECLHPRLHLGGLVLGLLLPRGQVLLLAGPLGVPFGLPLLTRLPVVLASLVSQALLPRREAAAPGHDSSASHNGPGPRTNRYSTTLTGERGSGELVRARPDREDRFGNTRGARVAGHGAGPGAGPVADRGRVVAGDADARGDVGRQLEREGEPAAAPPPAAGDRAADRGVGAESPAPRAAGMRPDLQAAEAGGTGLLVDAQHEPVEPLADRAERVVVEGVHPGGLEAALL